MIVLALGLAFDVTAAIQRALPDYTSGVQKKIEDSDAARQQLSGCTTTPTRSCPECRGRRR